MPKFRNSLFEVGDIVETNYSFWEQYPKSAYTNRMKDRGIVVDIDINHGMVKVFYEHRFCVIGEFGTDIVLLKRNDEI